MALIGLDIGTTGCKCIVYNIDGLACSQAYMEYRVINPGTGYFELDPEKVWNSVKFVISKAVKTYKGVLS